MSRRRFFHPAQTYNSFIHSVEEYKHSREPSTASTNVADVALNIQPQLSDLLTDPSAASPLLPPASPSRPLSPLQSHAQNQPLLPFVSGGLSSASHAKHGDHIDIWLSRRNLDAVIKRKSLLIFLNGLFGILLQIVLLQVGWDGQHYHDDDRPGELPVMLSIKIAMFLSSCLLVYQLLDRKQMQITIKYREKRRKIRSLVKPPLSTVSLLSLLSLRPSSFRWKLWLQCLICFFHPFPFFSSHLIPLHMSNKLGLLMFLRLHLVFRVIRDYSEIWLNRRSIKKLTAFSSRTPNFDWWLSVKTMVYRNPIIFATSFYLFCIVIFGYSVYILEREVQPDLFTIPIGFYLAFQCVTIDWASDVYDVYDPITWPGKLTCLTAAMMGLLLTSFIIGIVSQSILPSKFEELALNCLAEGTLVALADGTSVPIEQVQEGAAVLSYHAALAAREEEGLIVRQVDAVLDRGRRECVELVFSDGRSLVCTPDHRIRTADGRWVEAGELEVGTAEVAVSVEYPDSTAGAGVEGAGGWRLEARTTLGYDLNMAERAQHSLAFARLLGYVLTDGCVTSDMGRLYIGHQLDVDAALRDVFLLTAMSDDEVKVDEAGAVIPPLSAASSMSHGSDTQLDLPRRSSISQPTSSAVYSTATTALATPSSSRRSSLEPSSSPRGRSYSAVSTDAEAAAMDEDDELDSVERRRRTVRKRRMLDDSAAEGDDTAAEAAEAERPASATGRPRRATRRDVNYNEEQLLGELADEAVSEAESDKKDDAEYAQDDVDEDEEAEEEAKDSKRRLSSGDENDDESEGDGDEHKSVDKVTYGVHRDARVLPLFRVRLVGRRAVGKRRVWDLSVPSPQGELARSFVANGVVVHNCVSVEKAREKEKDNAARLIQYVWRNYRHEKELAEKLERKNPRLYEEISALEEKEFMEEFLARSKSLRNVRRERVDLEEQLMVGQKADGSEGGVAGGSGGGKLVGGDGEGMDVVERVERLVERVVEQQEEMMRWMRSIYKEKEKRKGRRDRERQKRRKRDEEERKQREEKQHDDGAQPQQAFDTQHSQPTEEQQKKRSRKSMRRGRGEVEAEGGEEVNVDAIGEVDENGAVRPAASGSAMGTGGRRRSISYSELRDLEKWGEDDSGQAGEGVETRRRANDSDRKETEGAVDEQGDVLGTLGRPPPLTTSTSSSAASLTQPPAAVSSIAPLSSFRAPSSFPTLPSLGAQSRSFSLPLSAFSLFAKPQPSAAHLSLPSPLAVLALTPHSQPPQSASSASSSLSVPVSASSSPLRVGRVVPAAPAASNSHDEDEKQMRRARERPREQDIARSRLRAAAPTTEQRDIEYHHDNEHDTEPLDTSLSDLTDTDNTAGADEAAAAASERARWRERERTRDRRRRVRSLSPHSVALAQMAISAMTGTSSSRRRTERKDEAAGDADISRSRRRSVAATERSGERDRERERSRGGGGGGGRERDRRSLLSASFTAGDAAAGGSQRRASISGPVMRMVSRGAAGEGGSGSGGGGEGEERGDEVASGSDRSGRERTRTAGSSGRHKLQAPSARAQGS